MKKKTWTGTLLLLLTAAVWGFAFSAQAKVAEVCGPFTVTCLRYVLGGLVLLPVIAIADRVQGGERKLFSRTRPHIGLTGTEWRGGLFCGLVLAVASVLQQEGLALERENTTKGAFIASLYVILVPVFGLLLGRRPKWNVWAGVSVALVGFFLLTAGSHAGEGGLGDLFVSLGENGFALTMGEWLLLASAAGFAIHILVIDHFAPRVDCVRMACVQFFVASLLTLPGMLAIERPDAAAIVSGAWAIAYIGVMSSGVGFTLQIVGQKGAEPAVATVILSLESVFGALGALVVLHEQKTPVQYVGCGIVFAAVLLAQFPFGRKKKETPGTDA